MTINSLVKSVRILVVLALALAILSAGLAAAQDFLAATDQAEAQPEPQPASYDSALPEFAGVLPPDDNPVVSAPGETTATFSYYMASGTEMRSRNTANDQNYASGGCTYFTSGASGFLAGAGMHLPKGSVVKYIRLYYKDTSATEKVTSYLTRYSPTAATTSDLVSAGSTGAFSGGLGYVVSTEITETVDMADYSYILYGWPGAASSGLQVCAIRVAYYAPPAFHLALPMTRR